MTGVETNPDIPLKEDVSEMSKIILDLCDTSNMVKLPRDKDGEVIRVGDTVYYGSSAYKVKKIIYKGKTWEIQFFDERLCISIYANPDDLTHKKPVTIESLVERFKRVLEKGEMSYWAVGEIRDIVDQLDSLGGSDD